MYTNRILEHATTGPISSTILTTSNASAPALTVVSFPLPYPYNGLGTVLPVHTSTGSADAARLPVEVNAKSGRIHANKYKDKQKGEVLLC